VVKKHFAQKIGLLGCMALTTLPAWAEAVESEASAEPDAQRAACDARCREDYQSNVAALQACLRDCGAVGPASPSGAIAPGHEAPHTAQQAGTATVPPAAVETTTVKGSKSNSDNRQAAPPAPPPAAPVESANLNLSKSNINSVSGEGDPEGSTDPDDER
jgi:hypothetical protein